MSIGPPVEVSIFIDAFKDSRLSRWLGKVCDSISGAVYPSNAASCEIAAGLISLRIAANTRGWLNDLLFEIPVGHALSMVLELGDRLELRRDGAGAWSYWVVRGDILVIGVGALDGKYGSKVELRWSGEGNNIQNISAGRLVGNRLPKRYSRAIAKLEDQVFELPEDQEAIAGPYYVLCLDLGDDQRMIPARQQKIAVLTTQQAEVRKAFKEFFRFEQEVIKAHIKISLELFPPQRDAESKQSSFNQYSYDRYRRLCQIENKINRMYRDFGIRPPRSSIKVPSFRSRLFGWLETQLGPGDDH